MTMALAALIRSARMLVLLALVACCLPAPSLARLSMWTSLVQRLSSQSPQAQLLLGAGPLVPSIVGLTGCYTVGVSPFQLQCPVGASIRVVGLGFNLSSALSVSVGSSSPYPCTVTSPASYGVIECTLPTSVQPSDYDTPLPVTVTVGDLTTAAFSSVTIISHVSVPTVTSIRGCTGGADGSPAIDCRPGRYITLVGQQFWINPSNVTFGGGSSGSSSYRCAGYISNSTFVVCTVPGVAPADVGVVFPVTLTFSVSPFNNGTTLTAQYVYTGGLSVSARGTEEGQ